jgi:Cyclin-dependent kinase inhibitor 3 (CDKN3)
MTDKPFPQSYWVHESLLCAGQYPGAETAAARDEKLAGLLDCGLRRIINLMWPGESSRGGRPFDPYLPRLCELAAERGLAIEWLGFPIRDASAPTTERMAEIVAAIADGLRRNVPTYVHCWGGHGRTGTAVACHLMGRGHSAEEAVAEVLRLRTGLPKSHDPFEGDQRAFIRAWRA